MSDRSFWQTLWSKRMLLCVLTGFSSGMPLWVLYQLLPAWLRDQGVSLETIGLMALVGLPYTWKFLWSPLLDAWVPPFLGRRRGWALVFQLLLAAGIAAIGLLDPNATWAVSALAAGVAFFSASQDVVLDAFRRELLPDEELGLGNAMFVNAYRVSGLVPGGLSLVLADSIPWSLVFPVTAGFMVVGVVGTFLADPVASEIGPPRTLRAAVVDPFVEFFQRDGTGAAVLLLAFMLLYKLGDSMATALITPFYLDVGFTKSQIGTIAKGVGLWSSVTGAFLGGAVMTRIGINRSLWLFGVVQLLSILGFAVLAEAGPDTRLLAAAVAFEYLGIGLGTAGFVAFLARETDKRFTATQFALFSSLVALPRTVLNSTTGFLAEALGWTTFFLLCTALAVPGMLLLPWVAPWSRPVDPSTDGEDASQSEATA
jgi:PAT family beta-lactamase induction signal transducer AmpG